jgi:hypothetical protein
MKQSYIIWLVVGVLLGLMLIFYVQKRKEKNILAIGLIVAALIYVCFALIWGDIEWLFIELLGVMIYGVFYLLGTRFSYIWIAVGWMAHPLWDVFLHLQGPGYFVAPEWYAVTCISFDFIVAAYILMRLKGWRINLH